MRAAVEGFPGRIVECRIDEKVNVGELANRVGEGLIDRESSGASSAQRCDYQSERHKRDWVAGHSDSRTTWLHDHRNRKITWIFEERISV